VIFSFFKSLLIHPQKGTKVYFLKCCDDQKLTAKQSAHGGRAKEKDNHVTPSLNPSLLNDKTPATLLLLSD
jgi:UDP-2,3-diacylglucosamine pyrophosphatase LpxH